LDSREIREENLLFPVHECSSYNETKQLLTEQE
jgi:hypothetical protein